MKKKTISSSRHQAISIASSPNTESDDIRTALKLLFSPWRWGVKWNNNDVSRIQKAFAKYFHVSNSYTYNSGRGAIYSVLKAIGTTDKHEVITQAYTCAAVPTGIIWSGATPIYVDIKAKSYNTTATLIKKAITPNTKAVIIQHTFGQPAEIDQICEMLKKINSKRQPKDKVFLIEDCAHSLGAKYKGKKIGEWGDAAILSFGQDKVISCTYGGMALSKDSEISKILQKNYNDLQGESIFNIFRAIVHPILWTIINRTYYLPNIKTKSGRPSKLSMGKGFIMLLRLFRILQHTADPSKINLDKPYVRRLSNAQAIMLRVQFRKLARYNRHSRIIAQIYNRILPEKLQIISPNHIFLRFPLKVNNPEEISNEFKKNKIILGNWYNNAIHLADQTPEKFKYIKGSCPIAERTAQKSLNLPTAINVSEQDAVRVGKLLNNSL
ncbi:DegT/DnrJ/EryC1/StrS family aminotransferase [Candidatus Dojkabacteria bacterium]|nr:DegT/DnrJ/EryC1/StrS family aminotransferase [Candidatus Dojkabacteria bacterium]